MNTSRSMGRLFAVLTSLVALLEMAVGFIPHHHSPRLSQKSQTHLQIGDHDSMESDRRDFLHSIISATSTIAATIAVPSGASALEVQTPVEMKNFIDPKGLFVIKIPNRFYAIRRTAKGDLPNESTGKGRRGSSIFSAGDMSKAEVIAVER